ncbi:MAG: hypothetical protein BWZ01_02996 [Deltaproteobacteria bacterium ADurb.BinA179]|nr:MAG: hypothetical protein BWZ01_02996 [Deltaproteobacteria bacterium ADurb.BinA179]
MALSTDDTPSAKTAARCFLDMPRTPASLTMPVTWQIFSALSRSLAISSENLLWGEGLSTVPPARVSEGDMLRMMNRSPKAAITGSFRRILATISSSTL